MTQPQLFHPHRASRRMFLQSASIAAASVSVLRTAPVASATEPPSRAASPADAAADSKHMRDLAAWTALSLDTPNPVPFGAEIVRTKDGERLVRSLNAVGPEHDPSAHAEVYTIRLGCRQLKSEALDGYTLYTTCEPCPMCMACALWTGLDRVVYGATLADAARFTDQIRIPATELVKRSDLACIVDGPIERETCLALFTNPKMRKVLEKWKAAPKRS